MAILKLGNQGPEVRKLQLLLNSTLIPSPHLGIDGDFGKNTHEAVVRYQSMVHLDPDGIVGPITWMALNQTYTVASKPPENGATANWLSIAEAERGVHEDSLPGYHNQRILEYHRTTALKATTDEVPWCSSFVNWVVIQAGYRGTNNALAKSWLNWGRTIENPRKGAIIVIKKKGATSDASTGSATGFHVAFYVSSSESRVRLLGGNQGDAVKYSVYPFSQYEMKGYRWPI